MKNVRLENVDITTNGYTGALAGVVNDVACEIQNCHVSGIINSPGNLFVGGLVGYNLGPISGSSSSCEVYGFTRVGGLVGDNMGIITNCHSRGSVTGNDEVGGLVGLSNNMISNLVGKILLTMNFSVLLKSISIPLNRAICLSSS